MSIERRETLSGPAKVLLLVAVGAAAVLMYFYVFKGRAPSIADLNRAADAVANASDKVAKGVSNAVSNTVSSEPQRCPIEISCAATKTSTTVKARIKTEFREEFKRQYSQVRVVIPSCDYDVTTGPAQWPALGEKVLAGSRPMRQEELKFSVSAVGQDQKEVVLYSQDPSGK